MILDPAQCPECGQPPRGTVERMTGCAEFLEPEEGQSAVGFEFEYSGSTDVWWDEQHTVLDQEGRLEVVCPDGHCWYAVATEMAASTARAEAPPAKKTWTPAELAQIREGNCPRCPSSLELYVTASFRGGRAAWGADGYAYTDLDVVEDEGRVACAEKGAEHFTMDFSDWAKQ